MSGTTGYPDYQRVVNWDGPVVINKEFIKEGTNYISPWIDCSRYSNIKLAIPIQGSGVEVPSTVTMEWRANSTDVLTAAGAIATSIAPVKTGPSGNWNLTVPNRAAYVRIAVEWNGEKYVGNGHVLTAALDNRAQPAPFAIYTPQLISGYTNTIKAGELVSLYPKYYYAGAISLALYAATAQAAATIETLMPGLNEWQTIWYSPGHTAGTRFGQVPVYVPYSAWRLSLIPGTEASLMSATAVASITGS